MHKVSPQNSWIYPRVKTTVIRDNKKQRGPVVRSLDLKCGDPEFKSRSDHRLDFSQVVPGSTPRLHLYVDFLFLKKLWYCVGERVKHKFGFMKQVDVKVSSVRPS